jgi:hypothetical protein
MLPHPMAWFHKEIFHFIEDEEYSLCHDYGISGDPGKSTIINTAFPIWSILGKPSDSSSLSLLLRPKDKQSST